MEKAGPRIVLFKTGGTITLEEAIEITNPFVSVYGQTAPGSSGVLQTLILKSLTILNLAIM